MKTKICYKCKKRKSISEFTKNKNSKDGLSWWCKKCNKEYRIENKKKLLEYQKEYYQKNRKQRLKYQKEYHKLHRNKNIKQMKKYYRKNSKKLLYQSKIYRIFNKKQRTKQLTQKRKTDIKFKLLCNLRTRLCQALKRNSKRGSTLNLLGCSIEDFKIYLESKFKPGMTWDNHGRGFNGKGMEEWHVDHITPCVNFDLSKESEQRKCFYYSNLQPLWAKENIKKKNIK